MSAIARVLRQYRGQYGCEALEGTVTQMSSTEGSCTFVTIQEEIRTLMLRHLSELSETTEGIDYLSMARCRGWNGK